MSDDLKNLCLSIDVSILDNQIINDLKVLMEDDFSSLLQEFFTDSQALIAQLENFNHLTNEELIRAAHTLKSTSLNFGVLKLGKFSEVLENYFKTGENDISAITNMLRKLYDDSCIKLKAY